MGSDFGTLRRSLSDGTRPRCATTIPAQVLQHGNVETFIVLRSVSPIIVAVADAVLRPHAATWPSHRTWASLLLILVGAVGYARAESGFSTDAMFWGGLYVVVICTDMARVGTVLL